jgi:uncharacterized protein YjgD (DUF1641 family)
MKIWIFTTKEPLEYLKLDEDEELKRSSTDKAKKGDIILIYQGNPYSNIQYIFKAKNDAYQDKTFRDDWETAIDLEDKVELKNPLTISEMKDDPILGQFGVVRKNFMGSFFEVPPKELKRFKTLILEKNSEIADDVNQLLSDHKTEKEDVNGISNSNGSECINDNHRGRAHITRDVCYLAHKNPNITDKDLINLIIDQVGDNQDYWEAHYQKCLPENCIKYNIESARSLGLINCNKFELTDKGLELINQLENNELFTYHYSIGTKRFFYKLAQEDESIKTAMEIVKKEERLRFWSPTCERTKKVIEKYHQDNNKFVCEENKHPECTECDHDILKHIDQTSIVLETLKRTGKYSGFVFWFTSRVTPMHLTGKEPQYQGRHILWDQHEEDIIVGSKGKITDFLNYISRNYVRARENKERVKGHKLSLLFNKKFPQYLANLSNSLINDDRHYYKSGSGYHARGRFIRHPWVFSRGWNKSNYVSYVLYIFEEDMSGFYLSLNLPWGYANQVFEENPGWNKDERGDYLKSCASTYKNKLESDVGIPVEFEEDIVNSPWWNTTILGKYYSFKNLPSENELEQDLKKILILSNSLETEIPRSYQIIQKLFKEYQDTFLETEVGVEHSNKYDLERQKVHQYFEIIQSDAGVNQIEDPPINHLLPIKEPAIAPVAIGDIKAFGYKTEDLPGLTLAVRDLIQKLNETNDKEIRKNLISEFKNGKYKKGFQTAMLTPTLYYINPDFWFINKKTVATFNLFSELLGDKYQITGNLDEYIDNNDKLHNLVEKLKDYIPELNFETFDEFCHWMCSDHLGNYACNKEKFDNWLIEKGFTKTLNIKSCLEAILESYRSAKDGLLSPGDKEEIKNILISQLPKLLSEKTENQHHIFSSAQDKFHYCPYVALMNEGITSKHTEGYFVNYMFREDMSGVYLALRMGVKGINEGETYLNELRFKSNELRKKINNVPPKFNELIDLKSKKASFAPFYEAGNIYSKFYNKEDIPPEENLLEDLKDMLILYDSITENQFLKLLKDIYAPQMQIALGELQRGKNVIFYGPPGSGKTVLAKIISEAYQGKDGYSLYTVHSGTDYYDLVCRIVPEINDDGTLVYSKERRFLLDALLSGKVLILDEINRTQIDTALGIFFTYLERDHRISDVQQITNILKNEIDEDLELNDLKQKLSDFRIIGTLNVYDKTFLFKLGDALKRRFTFIEITTDPEITNNLLNSSSDKENFLSACDYEGNMETANTIINTFSELNKTKPLGIGILKDALQFSSYFPEKEAADISVASLIVPFFENDLSYSTIKRIFEENGLTDSITKLESLNFGTSDINGI